VGVRHGEFALEAAGFARVRPARELSRRWIPLSVREPPQRPDSACSLAIWA